MFFVWIGVLAVILKYLEVGPFGAISWLWILTPLAIAFVWFEVLEPMLGKDKREDTGAMEKERKARVAAGFAKDARPVKR
jgi:small Trp-rich protein